MSTTITSRERLIDILSLSYLGDLLREQLGDTATEYVWPDEFEKAVADIGFSGCVYLGDSAPYDKLIAIGGGLEKMIKSTHDNNSPTMYKTLKLIKVTNIPINAFRRQTALESIEWCDGVTEIKDDAFYYTKAMGDVVLPSSVTTLRLRAFAYSGITSIRGDGVTSLYSTTAASGGCLASCDRLKTVLFPKVTSLPDGGAVSGRGIFYNDTALVSVQIGSVGYAVTNISTYTFQSCTQAGLTITVYALSNYVDTAVTNIRNGATNATIVVKAASATTYNGNSYAEGDTILTSTP